MRKDSIKILSIEILLVIIAIVFFFIKTFNLIIYSIVLFILLLVGIKLLGFSRRRNIYNKDVLSVIIITMLSYYLIIYIVGYFTGFLNTVYNHSVLGIIYNVFTMLIFIVIIELIRKVIVDRSHHSRLLLILFVVIISLVEIITKYNFNSSGNWYLSFIFTYIALISQNVLLTYIVYNNSFINTIVYKVMYMIPNFIIPIVPNFSEYFNFIIAIIFPFIVLYSINNTIYFKRDEIVNSRFECIYKKWSDLGLDILLILLFIIVIVVSGVTRYYALSIGSNSMCNYICTGDVVIVDKKYNNYKIGDVVAYKHSNKTIIHRITDYDSINHLYYTKGDNNSSVDEWTVKEDDLIGVVKIKIKSVGWPTVMLNKWILGGE